MKGIELPINILVVIAVAVIVLLGVIALYFSGFVGPASVMTSEGAKDKYCGVLMKNVNGCGTVDPATILTSDFDSNKDGTIAASNAVAAIAAGTCPSGVSGDNLQMLGICYYGVDGTAAVNTVKQNARKVCGCTS